MTNTLIDSKTGEIIGAEDAFERHVRIMALRKQAETTFLQLGKELHEFVALQQFKTLGHETFDSYVADPEVDIGRRMATTLIAIHRHYFIKLDAGMAAAAFIEAGSLKLELMIPVTTKDNVKEWLEKAVALSRSDLRKELGNKPHVSRSTGNNEWYTPPEYIEAARQVMGEIDLDPASSEIANEIVGATTFYTQENDGLQHDWHGRVWMNPPYASNLIGLFTGKLARHVKWGDVPEACVLVNNATETAWFNVLLDIAACVCFIRGRVKFIDAEGNPTGAPLQGQALLYIGPKASAFGQAFSGLGVVLYAGRN